MQESKSFLVGTILTFAMSIIYLSKAKNFKIAKDGLMFDGKTSAAIILQSMGNSAKSTILALLRDVIIFVQTEIKKCEKLIES